jgi:hypothetical protein
MAQAKAKGTERQTRTRRKGRAEELPTETYAMRTVGDCMAPFVPDGAAALIDPNQAVDVGDFVTLHFHQNAWEKFGLKAWLKRLARPIPSYVKFPGHPKSEIAFLVVVNQISPRKFYVLQDRDVIAIHKIVGYIPADKLKAGDKMASHEDAIWLNDTILQKASDASLSNLFRKEPFFNANPQH